MTVYTFCGIGNAAIDVIAGIEESDLQPLGLSKGFCLYPDPAWMKHVDDYLKSRSIAVTELPGGCAANATTMIAALGGAAAFIGKPGDDRRGEMFRQSLMDAGVAYETVSAENLTSTTVYTFITPDGERSFLSFHGACNALTKNDLKVNALTDSRFVYIDGYMLITQSTPLAIEAANKVGKTNNKLVFNPNDLSVIQTRKTEVHDILQLTDIVICNADEAIALSGCTNEKEALRSLLKRHETVAITRGVNSVIAGSGDEMIDLPALPVAHIVNTTGAGDAFAGGFIYGLDTGRSPEASAILGMECAGKILALSGPRLES